MRRLSRCKIVAKSSPATLASRARNYLGMLPKWTSCPAYDVEVAFAGNDKISLKKLIMFLHL